VKRIFYKFFPIIISKFYFTRCTKNTKGKIMYTLRLLARASSHVPKISCSLMQTKCYRGCPHRIKGLAGLICINREFYNTRPSNVVQPSIRAIPPASRTLHLRCNFSETTIATLPIRNGHTGNVTLYLKRLYKPLNLQAPRTDVSKTKSLQPPLGVSKSHTHTTETQHFMSRSYHVEIRMLVDADRPSGTVLTC